MSSMISTPKTIGFGAGQRAINLDQLRGWVIVEFTNKQRNGMEEQSEIVFLPKFPKMIITLMMTMMTMVVI